MINYYISFLATLLGLPAGFGKKNKIFKQSWQMDTTRESHIDDETFSSQMIQNSS